MGDKVEAGPGGLRHHIPRPHPNKMITDQIRSTLYLTDPGWVGRTRPRPTSTRQPAGDVQDLNPLQPVRGLRTLKAPS